MTQRVAVELTLGYINYGCKGAIANYLFIGAMSCQLIILV